MPSSFNCSVVSSWKGIMECQCFWSRLFCWKLCLPVILSVPDPSNSVSSCLETLPTASGFPARRDFIAPPALFLEQINKHLESCSTFNLKSLHLARNGKIMKNGLSVSPRRPKDDVAGCEWVEPGGSKHLFCAACCPPVSSSQPLIFTALLFYSF